MAEGRRSGSYRATAVGLALLASAIARAEVADSVAERVMAHAMATSTPPPARSPVAAGVPEKSMVGIQMTAVSEKPSAVAGESVVVKVEFRNTGSQPVEIITGPISPVVYELRSLDPGRSPLSVSHMGYFSWLSRGGRPPRVTPLVKQLAQGESATIEDDLALYAIGGIPPGRYLMVAKAMVSGMNVSSPPSELRIESPRIGRISSVYCPKTRLFYTAFVSSAAGRAAAFYQRETLDPQPVNGVFVRLDDAPDPGPSPQIAVTVHATTAEEQYGRRWIGWCSYGAVGAVQVLGDGVVLPVATPVRLDLRSPRLLSVGFQQAGNTALFLVAGMGPGGARIQRILFSSAGAKAESSAVLAEVLPEQLLVRYVPAAGGGRLQFVWPARTKTGFGIYVRSFGVNGKPEAPKPVLLYERGSPIAAIDIEPLSSSEPGWIHVLFGPEGPEQQRRMVFLRIPIEPRSERPAEWRVGLPQLPASAWAISSDSGGSLPVVARAGAQLLKAFAAGDGGWSSVADMAAGTDHLRLLSAPNGEFWAEWVDPAYGIRYVPVVRHTH